MMAKFAPKGAKLVRVAKRQKGDYRIAKGIVDWVGNELRPNSRRQGWRSAFARRLELARERFDYRADLGLPADS